MRNYELAWDAGFFDGEGTTSRHADSGQVRVTITQQERTTLDRFCCAVGVGKVYGPYSPPSHHGKVHFSYSVNKLVDVKKCLRRLWPHLSGPKRRQVARLHVDFLGRRS